MPSIARSGCCAISTTISAPPIRCRSSISSPCRAGSAARWRTGAASHSSKAAAVRSAHEPRVRAARHLRDPRPRDRPPVVRQPRHHGVVGGPLAQRGLRDLDGRQGHAGAQSLLAGLARRQRRQAVDDEAGCAANDARHSASGARPERGAERLRRDHLYAKAGRSSGSSKPIWARTRSGPASART